MNIVSTNIVDCKVYYPNLFTDNRGVFTELYKLIDINFESKQSNCSFSKLGVFRGIHRTPYAKLVTCVSGVIYDICVDLRKDSQTYNKYFGIYLDNKSFNTIYIPPYCGHGFLALKDSVVLYSQSDIYNKHTDETYCYKKLNIELPFDPLIMSKKDMLSCE